ncbi:MAG: hypothetical protein U1E17_06895 [Geminicoccaceae bacterium]
MFFGLHIRVQHIIHADRLCRNWFRRRYFWQGVTGAVAASERQQWGVYTHWQVLDLPQSPDEWVLMFEEEGDNVLGGAQPDYSLGYSCCLEALSKAIAILFLQEIRTESPVVDR